MSRIPSVQAWEDATECNDPEEARVPDLGPLRPATLEAAWEEISRLREENAALREREEMERGLADLLYHGIKAGKDAATLRDALGTVETWMEHGRLA